MKNEEKKICVVTDNKKITENFSETEGLEIRAFSPQEFLESTIQFDEIKVVFIEFKDQTETLMLLNEVLLNVTPEYRPKIVIMGRDKMARKFAKQEGCLFYKSSEIVKFLKKEGGIK